MQPVGKVSRRARADLGQRAAAAATCAAAGAAAARRNTHSSLASTAATPRQIPRLTRHWCSASAAEPQPVAAPPAAVEPVSQLQQQQQQQQQSPLPPAAAPSKLAGCMACGGAGRVPCRECDGRGWLTRAGYARRNPLSLPRVNGSKWTALSPTLGWRHFTVMQTRKLSDGGVFLLLQADCDAAAQLWVNAQTLRNRSAWAAGWLPLAELRQASDASSSSSSSTSSAPGAAGGAGSPPGRVCRSCNGVGAKPCGGCDATGRAQLIML